MNDCGTTEHDPCDAEWDSFSGACAVIQRRAAGAALLQDSRLELRYDKNRDEYQLGIAAGF